MPNEKLRAVNVDIMYRLNTKCVPKMAYAIEFSTSVLYVSIEHLYKAPAATSVKKFPSKLYVLYLPFVTTSLIKSTCLSLSLRADYIILIIFISLNYFIHSKH